MTRLLLLTIALLVPAALPSAAGDITDAIELVDPAVVTVRAGSRGGAGFVVNDKGHIVTNAHVLDKAKQADVKFSDAHVETATVVAIDRRTDLAVLRAPSAPDTFAELGSAAGVKAGDEVAALGAPLGLEHSVTRGCISSRERRISGRRFLQIDAALNPGNSGGPVIDDRGAVIGVSTVIARRAENVGFAIPSEVVAKFLDAHAVRYHVFAGDTLEVESEPKGPSAPEAETETPAPFGGEETPLTLPVIIAIAVVAGVISSAITSLLVLRVTLHRATQRLAAQSLAPVAQQPEEDLSDVDITLE